MNQSRIIFFFVVLAVVVGISRCNSRQQAERSGVSPKVASSPGASAPLLQPPPNASPALAAASASPSATPGAPIDFTKASEKVAPAVIAVSVFDPTGKLLRTGTGFFVSDDGRFVTSRSIVDGSTNAVAKTTDGKIYNVLGIVADAASADVAVMQAEVKQKVPFVLPRKDAASPLGMRIAAIGNPSIRRENRITETTVSASRSDASGDWLDLPTSVPTESLGAPVVNGSGDVIGLVTLQRGPGTAASVVRVSATLDFILAKVDPRIKPGWLVQSAEPTPPAEGPKKPAVATMGRPGPNSRLVYSPPPQYPVTARRAHFPIKGSGRYRVVFGNNGLVRDVQVIQSTRSETLDTAAVDALRRWKAQPGQPWEANVPITFAP